MPITGLGGKVEMGAAEVADIKQWSLNRTNDAKAYTSSSTAGQTKRLKGNKDWSGSFTCLPALGDVAFDEGDSIVVKLYVTATQFYTGTAIVTGISPTVNVANAEVQETAVTFGGDGALTAPVA